MSLPRKLLATVAALGMLVSSLASWPAWVSVVCGAIVLVVIFWPGTKESRD